MPWEETENEIRHRVREPGGFEEDSFRRIAFKGEKPRVYAIIGRLKGETKTTVQALRFPKEDEWTVEKAKTWVAEHFKGAEERPVEAGPMFFVVLGEVAAGLVRIPLAMLGKWVKGALKFSITRETLGEIVRNFRKRQADLVIDYEHASEQPEVAQGGAVPAAGWLREVEDQADARGILWGLAEFTERARQMIGAREIRYLSPAINWGARDKTTGEQQGATLTSVALTNRPFLEALPAIALSEGWKEDSAMAEEKKQTQEGEASATQPKIIRLSDVKRAADGRLDFAGIDQAFEASEGALVHEEVFTAMRKQGQLDRMIEKGLVLPAQRAHYEKLPLGDLRELEKSMRPQVDLSERGVAGSGGAGDSELKQIDQRMRAEMAKKRAADGKLTEAEALVLVASEHPDWAEQRRKWLLSETKEA